MLQLHSGKSSYKEKSSVPGPSLLPGYVPRPLSLSWPGSTGSLAGRWLFGNSGAQREKGK